MERLATGVLIFPEVEVLDFCGPFEVFRATRLDPARRREEPSPFDVFLVAETTSPVVTTGGMTVVPRHDLASCPQLDIMVVPGGWGTRKEVDNPRLIEWVQLQAASAKLTTSVCTGAFLLGRAGLLEGKQATTHWASLDRMRDTFPGVGVRRDLHWVEAGNVVTSAGISAGIDMSLKLVERLFGGAVARETARYMEYPFPGNDCRRV